MLFGVRVGGVFARHASHTCRCNCCRFCLVGAIPSTPSKLLSTTDDAQRITTPYFAGNTTRATARIFSAHLSQWSLWVLLMLPKAVNPIIYFLEQSRLNERRRGHGFTRKQQIGGKIGGATTTPNQGEFQWRDLIQMAYARSSR